MDRKEIWKSKAVFETYWDNMYDEEIRDDIDNYFLSGMEFFERQDDYITEMQVSDGIEWVMEKDYPVDFLKDHLDSAIEKADTFDEMAYYLMNEKENFPSWIAFFLSRLFVDDAKNKLETAKNVFPK